MVRIEIKGAMPSDLGAAVEELAERDFHALALAVQDEQERRRELYEASGGEVYAWAAWRERDDAARRREREGLTDAELAISRGNREWAERRILESYELTAGGYAYRLGLASGEAGR